MYPILLLPHLLFYTSPDSLLSAPPSLAPPSPNPMEIHPTSFTPFRPSIAVIVGILTTLFSITFLMLLYAKHCKRSDSSYSSETFTTYGYAYPSVTELRRHSGVGQAVVDSLPVIRFAVLKGEKEGLECAVCLGRFEPTELLRILPKCRHGFHVECVDTWLDAHSTCPLCRVRVEPGDILITVDTDPTPNLNLKPNPSPKNLNTDTNGVPAVMRVSGRYSTGSLQIGHTRPGSNRRSVDSVGCFDIGKIRKDRVLLPEPNPQEREAFERRFSHRIVVGDGECTVIERWSDLRPSDLVFLRSGRMSRCDGRMEINGRSLSEIAGVSRLAPSRTGLIESRVEEERRIRNWLGLAAQRTAKWVKAPPTPGNNGPSL